MFETFIVVAGRALGGGSTSENDLPKADPATAPRSFSELEAVMNRALG